ncbi:glycosyl hydrolase [Maribellus maritimus]|uniref:glycosyl hydrolase n=1 Tax=Maribellus maritimus TaxID=2870838 RepID=UPI001EEC9944|nr:glycosyl hydrolase [Maribellus maritimus]MCG6189947.1 hypothetical protein [Maribellus maritimus]
MKISKSLPVFFSVIFFMACSTEEVKWPELTNEAKPWTRWWWMGNAVDEQNLTRELDEMNSVGIGGVEITPIYGVKGEEDRFIEYLSPEFTNALNSTIEEANRLGMGVDLPPGSGWRCGGPFVPEEKGLWALRVHKKEVKNDEKVTIPSDVVIASASFVDEDKNVKVFNPAADFTTPANGTVYFAIRIKNGDKVKRPSDGGEGWAIDTFNEEITDWYLDEFWKRLGIDEATIRCFFHDSFEYTGDFTTHFTEEFKKRRGYDLAEYLYVLAGDCNDAETVARIKSDYRETLADLVLESFIQPMTEWAHEHNSLNRNQAHGSPGNILDLYAACDIPETEIFREVEPGTVDVFVNKYASSAAHVTGQKLVSSESFTWLEEHWTVTTSDMVRATNRFFMAGINHMFFHGTCYSPDDAKWPGWLFYASTQVNNRNPLWRELPALFSYIGRSQSVLQSVQPVNDLLIYWPYYDVAAEEGRLFNHLGVNKDAGWFKNHPISPLSENLMNAGYTFDYVSDKQLLNCELAGSEIKTTGGANYKAIIVPKTKYIPLETMQKLVDFVAAGGTVIFEKTLPESVPGMFNLAEREDELNQLKSEILAGENIGNPLELLKTKGIQAESSLAENGLHFLKMKKNNEDWYMVFNCGLKPADTWVDLNADAKTYVFLNPMNGKISTAATKNGAVHIQLDPEESVFIKCSSGQVDAPAFVYKIPENKPQEINGLWKIEFVEGGPVYPGNISTDKLQSWTKLGDQETRRFAGTAKYEIEFDLERTSSSGVLDLGEVKDCVRIKLNGKDYGTLLGPSFYVKVDNLQSGKNQLEVEVTNVAANRIRDLDIHGVEWRHFYDINLVNIDYMPFDASIWEIKDAGLLGPVTLADL